MAYRGAAAVLYKCVGESNAREVSQARKALKSRARRSATIDALLVTKTPEWLANGNKITSDDWLPDLKRIVVRSLILLMGR
jgi:hypothetical protein